MAFLTKDQILQADDLPRETVSVPEWGGEVIVRAMTGAERDAWEAHIFGNGSGLNRENVRAALVARTLVDEKGQRLFSDGEIAALGQKSAAALQRVFNASSRLNAITPADVEVLAKN